MLNARRGRDLQGRLMQGFRAFTTHVLKASVASLALVMAGPSLAAPPEEVNVIVVPEPPGSSVDSRRSEDRGPKTDHAAAQRDGALGERGPAKCFTLATPHGPVTNCISDVSEPSGNDRGERQSTVRAQAGCDLTAFTLGKSAAHTPQRKPSPIKGCR